MKLPSDPRLPTFGGPDYAKSLYARLYALFRSIAQAINGNADGIAEAATAAGTSVESDTNLPETDVQAALARFALNLGTSDPAARALLLSAIVGPDVSTPANVVAYGGNSNGNWVRFAGGLQVCLYIGQVQSITAVANGNVFTAQNDITWTFPASFVSTPVTHQFCLDSIGMSWTGLGINGTGGGTTVSFTVFSTYNYETQNPNFALIAIGKWK